jgi:hypothetical protein
MIVEVVPLLKRNVKSPIHEWVTLRRTFASRIVAAAGMVSVPVIPVPDPSGIVKGLKVEQ